MVRCHVIWHGDFGQLSCDHPYLIRDVGECGNGELCEGVEDHSDKGQRGVSWEELVAQFSNLQYKSWMAWLDTHTHTHTHTHTQ